MSVLSISCDKLLIMSLWSLSYPQRIYPPSSCLSCGLFLLFCGSKQFYLTSCFLFSSNLNSWLLICITVSVFIETYLQHERRNAHGFEREASRCFRKYALMTLLLAEVKAFTQLEKIIGFHNVTKLVSYMIFFFLTWSHSYDFVSVPGAL